MNKVLDLLNDYETQKIPHTQVTLYDHLVETGTLLENWGCHEALCLAGYFHSFYGTEGTGKKYIMTFSQREKLQNLIGKQAEEIVYLYCISKRRNYYKNFQSGQTIIINRFTHEKVRVKQDTLLNLIILDMANLIEEFDRLPWLWQVILNFWFYQQDYRQVMQYLPTSVEKTVRQKMLLI